MNQESESKQDGQVLIVDDEKDQRDILTLILESKGISCVTAASVQESCNIIRQQKLSLILLDWNLKGPAGARTGGGVLKFCRDLDPLMPVIVITGMPPEKQDVRTDAVIAEADGFLLKPFSAAVLTAHVERWLKRQRLLTDLSLPQAAGDILPLEEVKRRYSRYVVKLLEGNVSLAATRLGLHRHTLSELINSVND